LTEEAWAGLTVELEAGRIAGQADARRYREERWGVRYESVNGISSQCKRRKVQWKTGRRRHANADAAAQAACSQTSPPRGRRQRSNGSSPAMRAGSASSAGFGGAGFGGAGVLSGTGHRGSSMITPSTGACWCLLLPHVDATCLNVFLATMRAEWPEERIGGVPDGSGSHRGTKMIRPDGIVPLPLPPYSPELPPAAQVFRHLRTRRANAILATLADVEAALMRERRRFWEHPTVVMRMTNYPWWREGVKASRHLYRAKGLHRVEAVSQHVEVLPNDATGQLSVDALRRMIDDRVKLIAITHVPTNGGLINPATAVGRVAQ